MVRIFCRLTTPLDRSSRPIVPLDDLSLELYERGFARGFLDMALQGYRWGFFRLLSDLHDGKFHSGRYPPNSADVDAGQEILLGLAESLCSMIDALPSHLEDVKRGRSELISSLALDGFSLVGGRFIPSESAVIDQPKEVSLLQGLLKQAAFPSERVILEHFRQGEDLFVQHKWGPAIAEWRNFFEAVLRDIGELTSTNRRDAAPSSTRAVFDYLESVGFLDADERIGIMGSTYGFLCSGAHPGTSEEHKARMGMTLALTSGQVLVTKYLAWRKGGFKRFGL